MAVYKKLMEILKELISQKVKIDNRINNIYKYFPEINGELSGIFDPDNKAKVKEEENKCVIS